MPRLGTACQSHSAAQGSVVVYPTCTYLAMKGTSETTAKQEQSVPPEPRNGDEDDPFALVADFTTLVRHFFLPSLSFKSQSKIVHLLGLEHEKNS